MKRLLLAGLLLVGCAAQPVPRACYDYRPMQNPYGPPAQQEAIRQEQARIDQFYRDNQCARRIGDSIGYWISPGEVPTSRFRYVEPNYRGGLGGLEPY